MAEPTPPAPASPGESPAEGVPLRGVPQNSAPESKELPRVVFLGDSLTAGYTLEESEAFPAQVQRLLEADGLPFEAVNAGVSGDTSAGGLRRLPWLLRQDPDLLVVELGANDGLRGLPLEETEKNLRQIIEGARGAGAEVLLLGMMIPPNYGPEYSQGFAALFPRLAEEMDVDLMPFLLEGVAGQEDLNLPDGIHPTAEGHLVVAKALYPYLASAVRELPAVSRN